jgi:integrase
MKVTAVIRSNKADSEGLCPIYIRTTHKGRQKFASVCKKVPEYLWDKKAARVRSEHPEADKINREIEAKIGTIASESGDGPAIDAIKSERALRSTFNSFKRYGETRVERLKQRGSFKYARTVESCMNCFMRFAGADVLFSDITTTKAKDYLHYLDREGYAKKTKELRFTVLKSLINSAIEDNILSPADNPFFRMKKVRFTGNGKEHRALSIKDVQRIMEVDRSRITPERSAFIDSFVFSFYCGGVRASDLYTLRWENIEGDRLSYVMGKNRKRVDIKMPAIAVMIIEKYREYDGQYIFDPIAKHFNHYEPEGEEFDRGLNRAIVRANYYFSTLAKKMKLPHFTTHVARHSFASHLKEKNVGLYEIQAFLNHSSATTTERYLKKLDKKSLDATLDRVF